MLGTEKTQLVHALEELAPGNTRTTWALSDLTQAVEEAQTRWKRKKGIFSTQSVQLFHRMVSKFNAHSTLFSIIPQGSQYTSVIIGATATLVKVDDPASDLVHSCVPVPLTGAGLSRVYGHGGADE